MAQNLLRTLTFVLIFVLPILWTVISAFRVRDLPKDVKCSGCDSESVKFSDRSESLRAYEELKKAVREKLLGSEKKSYSPNIKRSSDDDDDDDDDDKHVIKRNDAKHKSEIKSQKVSKVRVQNNQKKYSLFDDDENDDDDDDDDENEQEQKSALKPNHNVKHLKNRNQNKAQDTKPSAGTNKANLRTPETTKIIIKKNNDNDSDGNASNDDDDDEDDDEDDDDDDELEFKVQLGKRTKNQVNKTPNNNKSKVQAEVILDKDIHDKRSINSKSENKLNIKIKSNDKDIQMIKSQESKTTKKNNDDADGDDDEDDDDDDDEEDDDDHNKAKIKITSAKQPTKPAKPKDDKGNEPDGKKPPTKQDLNPKGQTQERIKTKNPTTPEKNDDGKTSQTLNKSNQKKNIQTDTKDKSKAPKGEKPVTKTEPAKKPETTHQSDNKNQKQLKPENHGTHKKTNEADSKSKTVVNKNENIKKSTDSSINKQKDRDKKHNNIDEEPFETLHDVQEILVRRDNYLKEVNEALQRRNLLKSEFEDFYAFLPTFAPNFSRIHNPECRRHGQILLRQLRGTKLWALSMLDATAKFPSGILQGNGIQLGDFDQCLGSRARVQLDTGSVVKVQGKYCLALLDLKSEHPELDIPVHLAQAKGLISTKIDDPGHFIPRFSTLSWGICVPSTCEHDDVEVIVRDAIKHYQHTSGVIIRVRVDPDDCHTDEGGEWWEDWMELPTLLTLLLYAVVILLVVAGTLQDFLTRKTSSDSEETPETNEEEQPEKNEDENAEGSKKEPSDSGGVLQCFSLYHTTGKLLAPAADEDVSCIHGIRAVATLALLVAHKFLAVAATPYTNRLRVTEDASAAWWSWSRAGWMYTDCFLLLSGTLAAYRASSDSYSSAPRRLLTRYTRLTPALLAVVLFYAYIWDITGEGPMWGTLVTKNAEICQGNWLWNVFYVQNYFGLEEMCAPQTHQLALDMQLTILGCLIIWIMQLKPRVSKILLVVLQVWAAYSRYAVAYEHRLTMLAYHGASISQLYRTARLSYTSVFHRCTPYLIGLSLGILLQKARKPHKLILILGWLISLTLWGLVWYAGLDAGSLTYRYDVSFAAQYSALAPLATSLAIAWWIYAVHVGGDGFLQSILSSRPLALVSRLSYALYLCQFVIFFTKAATVRTASEFTWISLIDVQEISALILSSTVLTLAFVTPIQSLQKTVTLFTKTESTDEQENNRNDEDSETKKGEREEADGDVTKTENEDIQEVEEEEQPTEIKTSKMRFLAHREILEEIPEAEIEYEIQRERNEILDEILEEDDEETVSEIDEDRDNDIQYSSDNELEVIEEEGGEDDFWADRETDYVPRRSFSAADNEELEDNDWRNGRNSGAQYFRHNR